MKVKITESQLKRMVGKVVNEELRQFSNEARLRKTLRESIRTVLSEGSNESTRKAINDFFNLLETDPKKGTFATLYYTALYRPFNKFYKDEKGDKQRNPYHGTVYKHQWVRFNYGETYVAALERRNIKAVQKGGEIWVLQKRKGEFEKVDGYDLIEITPKGELNFPVIVKDSDAYYTIVDGDGNHKPIEFGEFEEYMRPPSKSGSGIDFRNFLVDKIYKLRAGGKEWINPHFKETYMGPQ